MSTDSYKKCQHFMPKELGHTANCLMLGRCNYLGSSCALYEKHTADTRKALAEAIEMKQRMNKYKEEHKNGNTNN